MSLLVEEGLLERAHSGGFVVRTFGFSDVIDAIELRGVLGDVFHAWCIGHLNRRKARRLN
jgi:DNA-binding GntR family transcriptional regulator